MSTYRGATVSMRPFLLWVPTAALACTLVVAGCGSSHAPSHAQATTSAPISTTPVPAPAGPWKVTRSVSIVDNDEDGGVSTGANLGTAFVAFPKTDGSAVVSTGGVITAIDRAGRTQELNSFDGVPVAPPAFDGRGRGAVLIKTPTLTSSGATNRLGWETVNNDVYGPPKVLAASAALPVLAADRNGNAIAVWSQAAPTTADLSAVDIRVSIRKHSGRFGKPFTLAAGLDPYLGNNGPHGPSVTAAIGAGGRIAVVGMSHGIDAWTGTIDGGLSQTPIPIGHGKHDFGEAFTAAIGSTGRVFAAWGQQSSGEDPDTPWLVQAASIAAGTRVASPVKTVDRGGVAFPVAFPQMRAEPGGGALLAWSGVGKHSTDPPYPVRVERLTSGGTYAAVQTLAPDGAVTGLVVAASGAAIVTWNPLDDLEQAAGYDASVRPRAQQRFGAVESVPVPFPADAPLPAFAPSGRPVLAYAAAVTSGVRGETIHLLTRDSP